jgi:hypothetical protein
MLPATQLTPMMTTTNDLSSISALTGKQNASMAMRSPTNTLKPETSDISARMMSPKQDYSNIGELQNG